MEQFRQNFHHNQTHRIVICKECKIAIPPQHFKGHINRAHKQWSSVTRRKMIEELGTIEGIAQCSIDVNYPVTIQAPVPYIEIFDNGRKCLIEDQEGAVCGLIRRGKVRDMQEHCTQKHAWINPVAIGRPAIGRKAVQNPWREGVICQQLFKAAGWQRLFEVKEEIQDGVESWRNIGYATIQKKLIEAKIQKEANRREELVNAEEEENRFQAHGWLQKTQWAKMLDGRHRGWLQTFIYPIDIETEGQLARIARSIRRIVKQAQEDSKLEKIGSIALEIINQTRFGGNDERRAGKIMDVNQQEGTMHKYGSIWVKLIAFTWRMYRVEQTEIEGQLEGTDISKRRPNFRFTTEQEDKFERVEDVLGYDIDQEEGPDKGWKVETKEEKKELDIAVLHLIIALLDHNTGDVASRSILVTGMAVIGIDTGIGWRSPLLYTPSLSAVITVARMLVLSFAVHTRNVEIQEIADTKNITLDEAEPYTREHYERIREMADRFMGLAATGCIPGPMNYFITLRTYGLAVRYNTTGGGAVEWRRDTILYGKVQFSIPQLRSMIQGIIYEARVLLCKELLLVGWRDKSEKPEFGRPVERWTKRHRLPDIRWQAVVDDASEKRRDWNFLHDQRNRTCLQAGDGWIMKRVWSDTILTDRVFQQSTTEEASQVITPRRQQLLQYKYSIEQMLEKLLVLTHLGSGQPARGTEITSIMFKNSRSGGHRGIFMEDGMMVYVTGYHKGYGQSAKSKVVHRYLPLEIGELMFYYMWLVQPYWEEMMELSGELGEVSPFLWMPQDDKISYSVDDREREAWEESEEVEEERRHQEAEDEIAIQEMIGDDEGYAELTSDAQLIHTSPSLIDLKRWDSSRVARLLVRETQQHLQVKITTLTWRHICIAIMREFVQDGEVKRIFSNEQEEYGLHNVDIDRLAEQFTGGIELTELVDEQAGHGKRIAGMMYGRLNTEAHGIVHSKRRGFRKISEEWHRLMMFPSTIQQREDEFVAGGGINQPFWKQQADEIEYHRWAWLQTVDLKIQLRRILGKDATFRGLQQEALEAIVQRKSAVVVIMGTGGGKSLLFMLPAVIVSKTSMVGSNSNMIMDGITVVVVPLISLRADMMRRCNDLGIACVEWSARRQQEWASIVFVTPESAVTEDFMNFLTKQRSMGRLDRIVIDECHTVLDTKDGWRMKMRDLRGLIQAETQMVYLTATLPPMDVPAFKRITGLETATAEQVVWFRASTTRKNIAYRVHCWNKRDIKEEELVRSIVDEMLSKYPKSGKIIVYCGMVKQAERLAGLLDGICYHRNVGSKEEKGTILQQLIDPSGPRVFTSTNALGLGVDAPTIRVVIHVGRVRRLRDYAQESGRAGRDGLKSEVIILHEEVQTSDDSRYQIQSSESSRRRRRGETVTGPGTSQVSTQAAKIEKERTAMKEWAEDEMIEFIQTTVCRRVVLSRIMDGNTQRIRCMDNEEVCDLCCASDEEQLRRVRQVSIVQSQERTIRREHQSSISQQAGRVEMMEQRRLQDGFEEDEFQITEDVQIEMEQAMLDQRNWARREREQEMSNGNEEQRLVVGLEKWKSGCIMCRIHSPNGRGAHTHTLDGCNGVHSKQMVDAVKEWHAQIVSRKNWARYSGCFGCGVPQNICKSWMAVPGEKNRWRRVVVPRQPGGLHDEWQHCQYRRVIIDSVRAMFIVREDVREWIYEVQRGEGYPVEIEDAGLSWMGQQYIIGSMQSNNMVRVFLHFKDIVEEQELGDGIDEETEDVHSSSSSGSRIEDGSINDMEYRGTQWSF